MTKKITRRTFARTTLRAVPGAAALGLAASPALQAPAFQQGGANDRVRLGFIGVANRGGQLMDAFLTHGDIQIVALCDVYEPTLAKANEKVDGKADTCGDFRRLINRKDVDAVVIATPDHWHAIQTVDACDAGKDVYVEKPMSITIHEGRRMVEAARRNKRVVQVGTHRRSSELYARLADFVQSGKVGKVTVSRAYRLSNMYPTGIGRMKPEPPPKDLNWDMWLGPRPERPYQANIAPYKFRWWQLYSSQMGNWGVHYLDAIRWVTGEQAPSSVCAMGGRFAVDDDRTVPDTLEVVFEFASGRLAVFGQYEASGNPAFPRGEIEIRGTQGTVYVDTKGFEVVPERGGQFQDREPRMEPMEVKAQGNNAGLTALHARNFLDCIKSREKPHADVEIGHRSTSFSLMANISLATKARLDWDVTKERFTNNDEANGLLHYEYRKPWKLG
ncbi:MAG TPA: Gfo/Idh/MocA family oxidoreductase [Thermoguttaceae bacterium]|nr:Gfo/Idh/MocA family oxidoreductase [Thermoguttaceae bacterium]